VIWVTAPLGYIFMTCLVARLALPSAIHVRNNWVMYSSDRTEERTFGAAVVATVIGLVWPFSGMVLFVLRTAPKSTAELQIQAERDRKALEENMQEQERLLARVRAQMPKDLVL
jgi:hypothetical protein